MRVKSFYRLLKTISVVVLFFFVWTFGPVWQAVAWAASEQRAEGKGQSDSPQSPLTKGGSRGVNASSAERFEKALESIRENITAAEEKAQKGQEVTTEVAEVKKYRTEIDSLDTELRKEFTATEKKLKDAKLPQEILDRHYSFVKHYEDNLKELQANLSGIEQGAGSKEFKDAIKKAKDHLEKVETPSKHVPLDPNKLPFQNRKAKAAKSPRLKKEEFEKDCRPQKNRNLATDSHTLHSREAHSYAPGTGGWTRIEAFGRNDTQKSQGVSPWVFNSEIHNRKSSIERQPVILAYNDIASDVPFALGVDSIPQSEISIPQSNFSQFAFFDSILNLESLNLAQADAPTADDLAENGIEIQFTPEIRELSAQLGNNSVRIFEAIRNNFRYEPYYGSLKGAQQTLREKAGNDFDLASLLISCYRAAGIPSHYVIATITLPLSQAQSWLGLDDPKMVGRLLASAGVPVAVNYTSGIIHMEHALVRAWVPFQNGRGTLNGPGDSWVYIDPSFKENKVTQLLDQAISAFDQTQYLSQVRTEDPAEYYSALLQQNLNTTPGQTVYALARHREIVSRNFGMLLGMPEYDFVTIGGYFQEIPDQYRYKISFELTDPESLQTSLTYQASTAEIAGKRLTLSHNAATADDQAVINRYGDIYGTPCYLIKLRPELKLEGMSISQGQPIGSGNNQTFIIKFNSPAGDSEQIVNNAVAGAYYAIAFDLQTVTQNMVFERTLNLQATNDTINAGGTVNIDDKAGELLYVTALTYFQKLDAANRKAQELLKFVDLRGVSEAIFSIDVETVSLFGIPRSVDVAGVHIDVDRDLHLPIPADGNTVKIKEYNLLIGSNSSYFEHKIIEDIYPTEAISAVKGLQIANKQGIQIQTINRDNINAILPTLQVQSEVLTDIANAVNAGKEVIIPQQEISLNDWHGLGYIVMDPQTGEAGYIISGGFAGGGSTGILLFTWIKATALSLNVAVAKETAAAENCVVRDYAIFTGEDNTYGTEDDVRLPYAKDNFAWIAFGPQNTKCDGKQSDMFYNPDPDFGAPLLELDAGLMDKKISKNLKLSDMVVNSGSSSYARISTGLAVSLDHYMEMLNEVLITPKTNSVYRTWYHNCELTPQGAVLNSNHMAGIAADVGVPERQGVAAKIALGLFGKIGGVGHKKYNSFVHVDIGKAGREW